MRPGQLAWASALHTPPKRGPISVRHNWRHADATGKGRISLPDVQELADLICSDPRGAGKRIKQDVEADGPSAQASSHGKKQLVLQLCTCSLCQAAQPAKRPAAWHSLLREGAPAHANLL